MDTWRAQLLMPLFWCVVGALNLTDDASLASLDSQVWAKMASFHPTNRPRPPVGDIERWMRHDMKISLKNVRLSESKHGLGFVVNSTRSLSPGHLMLEIPVSSMINVFHIQNSTIGAPLEWALGQPLHSLPADNFMPIVAFLLYVAHQPTSRWRTYIDALPKCYPHPLTFTNAELDATRGSEMPREVRRFRALLMRATRLLLVMAKKWPALLPKRAVTLEAVLFFFCAFMTRGFGGLRDQGIAGSSISLLPGLDFGNHNKKGAEPILNYPIQRLQVLSSTHAEPGSNFETHYGDLDTSRGALFFGMVPDGTHYAHKVDWDEVDKEYHGHGAWVRFSPETCQDFVFQVRGQVELFMVCWTARLIGSCPDKGPTLRNGNCLRRTALQHLQARLDGYGRSTECTPGDGHCSEAMRLAVAVSKIETEALRQAIRQVTHL